MSAEVMTEDLQSANTPSPSQRSETTTPKARHYEPTVREIIEKARSVPIKARCGLLAGLATSVLLWCSFTPLDWGWLGWIALAPLCLLIRNERPTRAMYRLLYLSGLAWSLPTLQWMRYGDAAMYPAWFALAIYLAMYFPAFVSLSRGAVHQLRIPMVLAVPVVWTGLEYLRAHLMTGFAWYFLGHTQHAWAEIIQISDLVGAYGVSFVLALNAAALAAVVPTHWLKRCGLIQQPQVPAEFSHLPNDEVLNGTSKTVRQPGWLPVLISMAVILVTVSYGLVRRGQADFQAGPRVALIQGNFPTSLKHDPNERVNLLNVHTTLTGLAVREQPDLIVWPETMFRWPLQTMEPGLSEADLMSLIPPIPGLNRYQWTQSWADPSVRNLLREESQRANAALFIGLEAWVAKKDRLDAFNSAVFVTPETGIVGRYDKMHRVIFGEYVPLKKELPVLKKLVPMPEDYGIAAGESPKLFPYRDWTFAPVICFEDTVPHLVRRIERDADRPVDVFVNLTNDGWFQGSSELEQHLITASFRAVECRTPLVRAVNTGISAVVDGDGVVVEPQAFIDGDAKTPDEARTTLRDPRTGRYHKSLNAAVVVDVPLDRRTSLYVQHGDWFAASCGWLTALSALGSLLRRCRPAKAN